MAKKKPSEFQYLRAHVSDDGEVDFKWKLRKLKVVGGQSHDENVGNWTDDEIARLAKQIAGAENDPVEVEVIRG